MFKHKLHMLAALVLIFTIAACSGQKAIVVDTTGLPPEQVAALEWKVKYAVALDWYEYQLKSYQITLDAMPQEQAVEVHKKILPYKKAVEASIRSFRTAVYAQSGDPDAQYEAYLTAKAALISAMTKLFAE